MKKGIAASKGYAIGRIVIKEENGPQIESTYVSDVLKEKARFEKALKLSKIIRVISIFRCCDFKTVFF